MEPLGTAPCGPGENISQSQDKEWAGVTFSTRIPGIPWSGLFLDEAICLVMIIGPALIPASVLLVNRQRMPGFRGQKPGLGRQ